MTHRSPAEENAALRLVIAQHDQYLTSMIAADPRGDDQSDFLDASFDLYGRLEEAGFGTLDEQQATHKAALTAAGKPQQQGPQLPPTRLSTSTPAGGRDTA